MAIHEWESNYKDLQELRPSTHIMAAFLHLLPPRDDKGSSLERTFLHIGIGRKQFQNLSQ
jgi:hypothetical protein